MISHAEIANGLEKTNYENFGLNVKLKLILFLLHFYIFTKSKTKIIFYWKEICLLLD